MSPNPGVTNIERPDLGASPDILRGGAGDGGMLGILLKLGAGELERIFGGLIGRMLGEGGAIRPMLLTRFGFPRMRGKESRDNIS